MRRQPQIFFCGFQEHGRQGYLHDFGRENTLNPTGICHDLRTDKQSIHHFRAEANQFSEKQFNEKQFYSLWVQVMGLSFEIPLFKLRSKLPDYVVSLLFKTTFKSTRLGS